MLFVIFALAWNPDVQLLSTFHSTVTPGVAAAAVIMGTASPRLPTAMAVVTATNGSGRMIPPMVKRRMDLASLATGFASEIVERAAVILRPAVFFGQRAHPVELWR